MEQSKVIVYARFGVDVTQDRIDTVKEKNRFFYQNDRHRNNG